MQKIIRKIKFFLTFEPDNTQDKFCTIIRILVMTVPFIVTLILTAMINSYVHHPQTYNLKVLLACIMCGLFLNSFLLFMSIICHYRHLDKIQKKYEKDK